MADKEKYGNDFWDLKKMISEKKKNLPGLEPPEKEIHNRPSVTAPASRRVISLSGVNDTYSGATNAVPHKTYTPEKIPQVAVSSDACVTGSLSSHPLILKVKIASSSSVHSGTFVSYAEKYWNYRPEEVPFTDFYAFFPTYANFTLQSFKYYTWWRYNFRNGISLKCSWSYISVFVSEIINCTHLVDAENGINLLWRLFEAYSDAASPLYLNDALCKLPEIICDYSLIHSVGVPKEVSIDLVLRAVKCARLREVFFEDKVRENFCELLIFACSEYEFEKSKFSEEISGEENKKLIAEALLSCIDVAKKEALDHPLSGKIKEVTTVSRHSYSNYVYVSPDNLRVITIDFCSVNRSYTLRNSVSGIVKQCENNIRSINGIKPRLKVFSLEPVFRDTVDAFFEKRFPIEKRKKIPNKSKKEDEVIPEYERFYENERTHEFSIESAKKIEEKSWQIVEKLVDFEDENANVGKLPALSENHEIVKNPAPEEKENPIEESVSDELSAIISVCPECADFLYAVFNKNISEILTCAENVGLPPQSLADRVNEAAFDVIGDILIDTSGEKIEIISEYEYIFNAEN